MRATLASRFKRLSPLQSWAQRPLAPPNVAGGRRSCWAWRFWSLLWSLDLPLESEASGATAPRPVTRFTITLPPGQQLAGQQLAGFYGGPAVALSPDGSHLAYVASQGGTQQLYLRAMDSLDARPVPGTEGAVEPFFSPDGQELGFFVGRQAEEGLVSGGGPITLGDRGRPCVRGELGQPRHDRLHAGVTHRAVTDWSSASVGRGRRPAAADSSRERGGWPRWPEFLPGGKAVLFAAGAGHDFQVVVQSVGTGERRNLIPGGAQPRYALSGHLVYAQGGNLMAVPFDPQRLTVTWPPVLVAEGVRQDEDTGAAQYSLSATGSLVYVPGRVETG